MPQEPIIEVVLPPPIPERSSRWRRWVFAINALANLLFMVYAAAGVRIIYAHTANNSSGVLSLVAIFFWAGLVAAALCSAALALGLLRGSYHLLLYGMLAGVCYCGGYLAFATTVISIGLHAGFLEPLVLWQLLLYQVLIIWSARRHEPPSRVHFPRALRRLASAQSVLRLQHAARAFGRALSSLDD